MHRIDNYVSIKRRYSRSINLERDLELEDSVLGYIPTHQAIELLDRFSYSANNENTIRAWTITGVYGSGKSSFAHFLASLCSQNSSRLKKNALSILRELPESRENLRKYFHKHNYAKGMIRAIATASFEPMSKTILKALKNGLELFCRTESIHDRDKLITLKEEIERLIDSDQRDASKVIKTIKLLAQQSENGIIIIVDELGNNLEYSAQIQEDDELSLLQQIAEMPSREDSPKVFLLGLLHRSFSDYGNLLSDYQRKNWAKVQGRFENIPFSESSEQQLRIIRSAIEHSDNGISFIKRITELSEKWYRKLKSQLPALSLSQSDIQNIYPLHPITGIILPLLCSRYAQNERTLFTFLAGEEPFSFKRFIKENYIEGDKLPTLKLHQLYDYFIESAGITSASLSRYQRWNEIHNRIQDAHYLPEESKQLLKSIGVLNLASGTGYLKATKELVLLSQFDSPNDCEDIERWNKLLDELIERGFVVWRKQIDELRIWEGSDFDIERAIVIESEKIIESVAVLLTKYSPLRPIVAQRHSYTTGSLRFYECKYIDSNNIREILNANYNQADGLICYWIGEFNENFEMPDTMKDGRPIILIKSNNHEHLTKACIEYTALCRISDNYQELSNDGIARRELKSRLAIAKEQLEKITQKSFDITKDNVRVRSGNTFYETPTRKEFYSRLSDILDRTYSDGLRLWNELINRKTLTSQGSKARRELIDFMINNVSEPNLSIQGYGPERSLYDSVLYHTGLHRLENDRWQYCEPKEDSGIWKVWKYIEEFCLKSVRSQKPLDELLFQLSQPPYGVKEGPLPILLASVLLKYQDELSIYHNGTFLPVLSPEHIDLMTKNPQSFSIKYFKITGLTEKVFNLLESALVKASNNTSKSRNSTLLRIVKPLIKFISSLPDFSKTTKTISKEAIAVRESLLKVTEPDSLIFKDLPIACGLSSFIQDSEIDERDVVNFRDKLVKSLREISQSYDRMLERCKDLICKAFHISDITNSRKELAERAFCLIDKCSETTLRSLILAFTNKEMSEKKWLESVVVVIYDKPANSFNDRDTYGFDVKLSEVAKRFENYEFLSKSFVEANKTDQDVKKLTITLPTGEEKSHLLWTPRKINEETKNEIDKLIKKVKNNRELKEALFTHLANELFS
jgi:hypothetical protein